MPDPQSLAKGLMADGPVMRAYEPSWRDRMAAALMGDGRASPARAQVVMGLMGSRGLGPTGLSAVDATPAGAILDMQQAAQHGDKAGMAMAAAGFVPGAKVAEKVAAKIAEAAPAASKGIIAYHGSPHSFDRFDMSKIGTGEGAQAYGHGLYFADNEDVARNYRNALAKHGELRTDDGRVFNANDLPYSSPEQIAANIWIQTNNLADAKYKLGNYDSRYLGAPKEDIIRELEALHKAGARPNGNMYQVKINAEPEHFLDWDKPLSEQSPQVRDTIRKSDFYKKALDEYKNQKQWYLDPRQKTGESYLKYMRSGVPSEARGVLSPEGSLLEAGIPGIKYLDQGSRGAGEGSRNYVVFDDSIIEIMRKYGLVGSAGAAMAAEILQRQNGGQPQGQAVAPAM